MALLSQAPPPADHRLHYGPSPLNFGDLRLPKLAAGQRAPVVMFIHGGWWKAAYGIDYAGYADRLCEALRTKGVATWAIEYRRVGDDGGGWPGTFQDVALGYEYLAEIAKSHPLDLNKLVVSGHSAGGHLAFWLAGRHHVPASSPVAKPAATLPMHAVVALAGAVGLQMTIDLSGYFTFAHDKHEVYALMGGPPVDLMDRYKAGDPAELLPFNIPQILLQGTEDSQIPPELPGKWAERARRVGETVKVQIIQGAGHFDVVDTGSRYWPMVEAEILKALA
jgi:acetyl esterase/lipase